MQFEHDMLDIPISVKHRSHTSYNVNMALSLHISVVLHKDCKLKLLYCTSPAKENKKELCKFKYYHFLRIVYILNVCT